MSERSCATCRHSACSECDRWDEWEPKDPPPPPRREITQIACCQAANEWELFALSPGGVVWQFNGGNATPPWVRLPDLPQE